MNLIRIFLGAGWLVMALASERAGRTMGLGGGQSLRHLFLERQHGDSHAQV